MVANKSKVKAHLPIEHIVGFCNTFKKITKNLGFHLTFKTNDLQNIISTTIATDDNVTINILYLFVPVLIPNIETPVMFIESKKKFIQAHMNRGMQNEIYLLTLTNFKSILVVINMLTPLNI